MAKVIVHAHTVELCVYRLSLPSNTFTELKRVSDIFGRESGPKPSAVRQY